MARPSLTASDIEAAAAVQGKSGEVIVPHDAIITDEAREVAAKLGVRIRVEGAVDAPSGAARRPVCIGNDHGGFELKQDLKRFLTECGYEVHDAGTDSAESVDYPDFAATVARAVASGAAWRGIMIDAAGIGSCMAANKIAGVRAALCYDRATARNSREHNNANVLTLGARMHTPTEAREIVRVWLNTDFGGGHHQRRVDKISDLEKASDG